MRASPKPSSGGWKTITGGMKRFQLAFRSQEATRGMNALIKL